MQHLGGMQRPVWVTQHLSPQQHDIRLPGRYNLFRLSRFGYVPDCTAGNSGLGPDPGRKRNLKSRAEWYRLIGYGKPRRTINQVNSDILQ
jgi:hypothetical protein